MNITYRKLSHADIAQYHQARLQCLLEFPDCFATTYEEEKQKENFLFDLYLKEGDQHNFVVGAFDGDTCIGLCGFLREFKKRTSHRGKIVQMYVAKAYQGKGVGKALLSMVMYHAFEELGVEQIILEVIAANKVATQAYQKLGFEEYGFMKKYFKLGDQYLDAKLMIKNKI
ncbi:GNAT family protein [Limibacter armeniacum]|uniref:GNAT family N-acetyltransferase n=1 Tax=Limibacter armeniacum TaxID=466084 RepID=UPI002FE6B89F